jgi:L-cysteine S-thiosulfotransferase
MRTYTTLLTVLLLVMPGRHGPLADGAVSGYDYLQPDMQAMQDDLFSNPGMLTVEQGEALFSTPGKNGKSCADCHGQDGARLDVKRIARYPVYSEELKQPLTLHGRIQRCWTERLGNTPISYPDEDLLALESYVRHLARGEPVNVAADGALAPYFTAGSELFHTRFGQVDIACHQCHDYHAGQMFRGQVLSQGQSNGFPVYRFTEGRNVGLQERITQCLDKLRAEPFAYDSPEYLALEVYLSARSNGLPIETPAIRY